MNSECGITELFFSLIRQGIGIEEEFPKTPTPEEWAALFHLSTKHAIAGITFRGIESLPKEQRPPKEILLQWYSISEKIKKRNKELTKKSISVSQKFKSEGFRNCILKGQGIALLYPIPELRTPGDIDIWLEGGCEKVLKYIKKIVPDCKPKYHHVDFNVLPGTAIEVHYRPTWMYNPLHNKRLQKYFTDKSQQQFTNEASTPCGNLAVPTTEFNQIYIPVHIYRHLFDEGIGLRQILDYYFVLKQGFTNKEKTDCQAMFKQFGMSRFMHALMYVMQEVFKLSNEHVIISPDKKHGKHLLQEILISGNFGKYDPRYKQTARGLNFVHIKNQAKRSLMLITHYPSETLWNPLFKTWHYFWRKRIEQKQP